MPTSAPRKPPAAVADDVGAAAKAYIAGVLDGSIIVGRLVRLAVERHVRDLAEGHQRGLSFDEAAAARAIKFFSFLRHSKGEWGKAGGHPFVLSPWQAFILWVVFGWKRADGTRRFRVAYNEIARKNGKSTFAAGIGLELFIADGEPGAEVYSAATKRDQARLVHAEAVRMVRKSPALRKRIGIVKDNLHVEGTASKFEPLSADANTMDGLNVSGAIVDELHQHKTRGVWDSLDTATGSRRQPLIFAITTAGHDQEGVCYQVRKHAVDVLEGSWDDDSLFAYVATIDEGDDWQDERCWAKANPNLEVSVKLDALREKAAVAKNQPAARNAFLTKRLNVWTDAETLWLNLAKWDACGEPFDPATLKGRRCFGGLDLSSKIDLTAFALMFPPDDGDRFWRLLTWFWIPAATAVEREKADRVRYRQWADEGLLVMTPGDVVDYAFIEKHVVECAGAYGLVDVAFDTWNATQTATQLGAQGVTMVETRQGHSSLSEPSKKLEALIMAEQLRHGGHEVLRWNARCVTVKEDENQNIRPVKPKRATGNRIDGIVASIMALGRAIRSPEEKPSVYEKRGVIQL